MGKFKKIVSAFASAAVAASAFIGVTATVRAEAVITYSDGKVTTTESGVVIVASYSGDRMTGAKTYDIEAGSTTDIDASDGDRIMFWENKTNAKPLTAPITVGAATEAPTAEPTPTPTVEPTETPVPDRVYIDESFDSYTAGTVIASASGAGNSAPKDVTYGNITYKAGYRKDGIGDKISFTSDGSLSVLGTRFGSSGRGVLFTFETVDIPAVSELADGQVIAMSFDMATSSKFTVTGYGEIAAGELGLGSTVNVRLVLDSDANKQYMIISNMEGEIIDFKSETLSATGFEGMDFCSNSGTAAANATFTIDNLKVETTTKPTDYKKMPDTVLIQGGQTYISAPKDSTPAKTDMFTAAILDQNNFPMNVDELESFEWAVYPAGTEIADDYVSIDQNGFVSVSPDYHASNNAAAYDVCITAKTDDRGQTIKKTLFVGNNDVIYYEPVAWDTSSRTESKSLAVPVTLPDIAEISVDLTFGTLSNSSSATKFFTILADDSNKLVGLRYNTSGKIEAWTGYKGTNEMNQCQTDDNKNDTLDNKLTEHFTLVNNYTPETEINVHFTIDKTNKSITVSCGDVSGSLSYTSAPQSITGFYTGNFPDNNGKIKLDAATVVEPDPNYLSIVGDKDFAKVSGRTITRNYTLNQSVIVSGEIFNWSVSPEGRGVTVNNGVLSVADTAVAGTYALTATSTSNLDKTATVNVDIGDFQTITQANATIKGAHAYNGANQTGTYAITKLVDSYGDDVTALLPAAEWSSSNTQVATINASTGELRTVGSGETNVTATIRNGSSAVTVLEVPVTVAQYYITANATGNSTTVDTSALIANATDPAITGYQITTAKNDGTKVNQTTVTAVPATVDTTGADKLEIAPIFTVTNVTGSNPETVTVPADTYNFKITEASGEHFDPYVNDQMLANNMLQGGSTVNHIAVNDIAVEEGYATLNLRDRAANSKAGEITMVKSPSIVDRTKKVYVLGDSLVCIYYNGGDSSHNYQTGWGQVLQSYLKDVEVVDLGNSGVTAEGLAGSAITQVVASGRSGDIMLLESGYNDRSYSTQDKMKAAVTSMYTAAKAKDVDVVMISPNASQHDYKASISWGSVMGTVANDLNAKYIDLSALSYNALHDLYGDSFSDASVYSVYNVSDRLHSTYNGAHKMASIVAGGMIGLGFNNIVNTDYKYTFKDSLNHDITCQATASN